MRPAAWWIVSPSGIRSTIAEGDADHGRPSALRAGFAFARTFACTFAALGNTFFAFAAVAAGRFAFPASPFPPGVLSRPVRPHGVRAPASRCRSPCRSLRRARAMRDAAAVTRRGLTQPAMFLQLFAASASCGGPLPAAEGFAFWQAAGEAVARADAVGASIGRVEGLGHRHPRCLVRLGL